LFDFILAIKAADGWAQLRALIQSIPHASIKRQKMPSIVFVSFFFYLFLPGDCNAFPLLKLCT